MSTEKLTRSELVALSRKLDRFQKTLGKEEAALLAGMLGMASEQVRESAGGRNVSGAVVKVDGKADLKDAFASAFVPGRGGRLIGDRGGDAQASEVNVSVGGGINISTTGPSGGINVGVSAPVGSPAPAPAPAPAPEPEPEDGGDTGGDSGGDTGIRNR